MERVQKKGGSDTAESQRIVQGKSASESQEKAFSSGIDNSPRMVAQRKKLNSLFGAAMPQQNVVLQKMSVETVDKTSYVIKDKKKNHIGATKEDRDALAHKKPGPRTIVSSESILTNVVDADNTNLENDGEATLNTSCVLYQYTKTGDQGRNQPVTLDIDGEDTNCEIGVHHDSGKDQVAIHHFQIS